MALHFFLSYASADDDRYVLRFYRDLSPEVRDLIGAPASEEVGFLAVCSRGYFRSESCGREWTLFSERLDDYERRTGVRPSALLPLVWVSPTDLPPVARRIQYHTDALGDAYRQNGLRLLLRLPRLRGRYLEFISALAEQIVVTADRHPLPPRQAPIGFHSISESSIPSAFREPVYRGILAIDIQGFGHGGVTGQAWARLRGRLHRLLEAALAEEGISLSLTDRIDAGDGLLLLVDGRVSKARLLHAVTALAVALADDNRQVPSAERMRLRVAMHVGEVVHGGHGLSGQSVVVAARILDAEVGRATLAQAPDADVLLLVSEQVYQDVVRHHYPGIDPASFQPVWVRSKETSTRAWAHLPNQPTRPDLARVGAAVIEQPASADLGEDAWSAKGRVGASDITIVGDVIAGHDHARSGDLARRPREVEARTRVRPLPADVRGFTGREEEVGRLRNLLTRSGDQLDAPGVCVTSGVAGVGKSALAIHVAHQVASAFPDPHGLRQGVGKARDGEAADALQDAELELPADHRRHPEVRDRLPLQPSHPPADEGVDLLGNPQHGIDHRLAGVDQAPLGQQDPYHLADEERVAGGDVMHLGDHRFRRSASRHPADVGAHLRAAEPPQPDPVADPCQLGEQLDQLVDALLRLPVCAKQHDALAHDRLREEPQQQKRRLIRRMQVVKDHEQPAVVGDLHQEPGHPIEQPEAVALRVGGRRRRQRLGGPRPAAGASRGQHAFLELAAGRPDDLDPGPVRGGAAMLPASAREHPPALLGERPRELLHQPGLADAGLARDHE